MLIINKLPLILMGLLSVLICSLTVSGAIPPFSQCVLFLQVNGTPIVGASCDFTDNNSVYTYDPMTDMGTGEYCIGINGTAFPAGTYSYYANCTDGVVSGSVTSSFTVDLASSVTSSLLGDLEYPYYMDVNVTETIKFYFSYISSYPGGIMQIWFSGSFYNMTDEGGSLYDINVISHIEEDVPFAVYIYNTTDYILMANGTMRWRIPFYETINFWQADNYTDTSVKQYKNEFQYVYMQFANNTGVNPLPDASYLDSWFNGWLPFYHNSFTNSSTLDRKLSFWSNYTNGEARVKLYEAGNYTIGIVSMGIMAPLWTEEFIYPQYATKKYSSKILNDNNPVNIGTESNATLDVYVSMWEVNKFNVINNILYNIAIVVFGVIMFILLFKFAGPGTALIGTIGFIAIMKLAGLAIL